MWHGVGKPILGEYDEVWSRYERASMDIINYNDGTTAFIVSGGISEDAHRQVFDDYESALEELHKRLNSILNT